MQILDDIGDFAAQYDHFFVDLWGCVLDGVNFYPGATDRLRELRNYGTVTFMTNVPWPSDAVLSHLEKMDLPDGCYDDIITSGDVTIQMLRDRTDPWHAQLGRKAFNMSSRGNTVLLDAIGDAPVPLEDADYLLVSGFLNPDQATPDHYVEMFEAALARALPLICANPDVGSAHGDTIRYRAGALAKKYGDMGGQVILHGKPQRDIYDIATARRQAADPARILMIGDNLMTDIAGAANAGIDSLWIAGGLHAGDIGIMRENADARSGALDVSAVERYLETHDVRPTAVTASLGAG